MSDKAELTKAHILEKVAPIFNKKGFVATSLSDLTQATGLTKGAIYCHYENKEDLAVQAYKLMVKKVIRPLTDVMEQQNRASSKLKTLTDYYRNYHSLASDFGGCPVLNIGINAHYTNSKLFELAKDISRKLENGLKVILINAVEEGYLKESTDPDVLASKIFSMIEGGVFMATLHHNGKYLLMMMDEVDQIITVNRKG